MTAMLVSTIQPDDHGALDDIARFGEQGLDIAAERARAYAHIWVARPTPDAGPAAFLLAWAVADELHILNVATHPDFRRRGAARALLHRAIEHARSHRARLVLLEVRRSNRAAIDLYRSHGFSAIGIRRGYYADTSEDAIEMMLAIDPETGTILPRSDDVALPES